MSYYGSHREELLEYQKEYNILYHDKYLDYQKWYYYNVKKLNYVPKKRVKKVKPTKITKTFLKQLEKICLRKIKDYNDTLYYEQEAKKITNNDKAFEGFSMKNGKFTLVF